MSARKKESAGILLYRWNKKQLEVLLIHPGGPFWAKKDDGAWSIPKGEPGENENRIDCARREFREETGVEISSALTGLEPRKQKGGKLVFAWAAEGDFDTSEFRSNFFEVEWPPRSGKIKQFPEADKVQWWPADMARKKINPGQVPFIEELEIILSSRSSH